MQFVTKYFISGICEIFGRNFSFSVYWNVLLPLKCAIRTIAILWDWNVPFSGDRNVPFSGDRNVSFSGDWNISYSGEWNVNLEIVLLELLFIVLLEFYSKNYSILF